jgi:hypothetical protein
MQEKNEQNDTIKIKGSVRKQLFAEDGSLKYDHTDSNLVVTSGKNYLAAWLAAASQPGEFMSYVGLGTSSTAPAVGQTALVSEFSGGGYSRQVGVLTSSTNTWQNVSTFGPGNGTGAVTEAGLFNISSSGTMFARQVFSAVNKGAGDTLILTWQVTFN